MNSFNIGDVVRSPKGADTEIVEIRRTNVVPEYRLKSNTYEPEWNVAADLTALDADGNPVTPAVSPADVASQAEVQRALVFLYSYFGQDTRFTSRVDVIREYIGKLENPTGLDESVFADLVDPTGQPIPVPPGDIAESVANPATIDTGNQPVAEGGEIANTGDAELPTDADAGATRKGKK